MSAGWRVWLEAARPKTLPAAVVPVMLATALAHAHGGLDFLKAAICLGFALLVQVGTNYANDYFDFVQGADTAERVGPRRAVAAGLVTPRAMLVATVLVLAAAFAVGLLLVRESGWWLLPVGVASVVCAVAYTGGPYPLGYNGLGDVFVFIFFGLVAVVVTFVVQTGRSAGPDVWLVAAAVGALAANILVANNYRDAETDVKAGKRTLVVRFGRRAARWQYGASLGFALAVPAALFLQGYLWPVFLPAVLAPFGFRVAQRLGTAATPAEQIAVLADTAKFLAGYGVLLSAGLVLGK